MKDLQRYLEKNEVEIPSSNSNHVAVLVSDSKASRLESVYQNKGLPLVFLYRRGANTLDLFNLLKSELPKIKAKYQKPAFVYFWSGTCDITRKNGRYIDIRAKGESTPTNVIAAYENVRDFTLSLGCKIKFVGVPCYLVSLYNDIKGYRTPSDFLDSDAEVELQVDLLNEGIVTLNDQLGQFTLKFNCDLRNSRKKKRKGYYFELLEDGLHPGVLLAKKWLRRLEIDIVRECFQSREDAVIEVNPQEYLDFEENEHREGGN